jgi:GR25 family glycosyltransferase involved in LPS biosynthesis
MVELEPVVITVFDGDVIKESTDAEKNYQLSLWNDRIGTILPVLLANVDSRMAVFPFAHLYKKHIKETFSQTVPGWATARTLTRGECSVLMKHFFALVSIANGDKPYGLIAEDDIVAHEGSQNGLRHIIEEALYRKATYVDLAGGCGLVSETSAKKCHLASVMPARTRTNACYLVSKELASAITNRFLPYCFPIDWHLQYLLLSLGVGQCYWAVDPPFLHGSETGMFKSWRINQAL